MTERASNKRASFASAARDAEVIIKNGLLILSLILLPWAFIVLLVLAIIMLLTP
jgi:hypothetical protein